MGADILLVDDDPKVLEILTESLERRGHRVSTAGNGRQALQLCANRDPQLVIVDMVLPDMDGFVLMQRMRGDAEDPAPVLFISADGDIDKRLQVLDGGAEDYLVKPISLRELNAKIEGALRRASEARMLRDGQRVLESQVSEGREDFDRVTRELKRQLLAMRTLFSVSQDLNRTLDPQEMVNVVALTLLGELQVSSMAIFSVERENDRVFRSLGVKGFQREKFADVTIDGRGPFVEQLERDSRPRKIARNPDRRWTRLLPDLRLAVFEYVTPISVKGTIKGLIFTGPKIKGDEYGEYELDMLTFVANSAGVGMENTRLLKQLQVTYVATLKTMISVIEAKDRYTKGHTERVAAYAMAIANRLDLPEELLRRIMFGALLHDIGKLGINESILHKEGRLDDSEWQLLKAHPEIGAGIVEKMEFLSGVAEIVRHHHESWDGRGYPAGLLSDEIPLGARIVTVADAFDAMTTDRSYRRALSVEQAIQRLEAGAGTQFDPRLVRALVQHLRGKGYDLIVAAPQED
jgi:putative nucleotidyltransferase with HDIG domain